jgi:Mg2+ and Co2+ transporter CorA
MTKLVDADRFAQVIEKIWNKVKRLEDENQKALIKIGNLERALVQ